MNSVRNRAAVALTAVAVAASTALAGAPAQAAATNVVQVRPADLILVPGTVSGTTGTAKADFLAEGVHIQTDNGTDGARGYWKVGVPLSQVHAVEQEWYGTPSNVPFPGGTSGKPAMYYNIDIDGDGKPDGQFVGETFYGGADVQLNRDAQDFTGVTPTVPANTFQNAAPCDNGTARPGATDTCSPPNGAGGEFHGTLDDWNRRFVAAGKTANIVSAGFLANGLITNGVLRSVTIGPNQYVFTNLAKTKVTLTAAAKRGTVVKGNTIKVKGTASPVGVGAKAQLQVLTNGTYVTAVEKVLGADGKFKLNLKTKKTGKVKLRVLVTETNTTAEATSEQIRVKVLKKK